MIRNIFASLAIATIALASCSKSSTNAGCSANQMCTAEFASVSLTFVDASNKDVEIKDLKVTNLRTNKQVVAAGVIDPGFAPYIHIIATDQNKGEFSSDGDDVRIEAVSVANNKTITSTLRISGGCNCHIAVKSGSLKILVQ